MNWSYDFIKQTAKERRKAGTPCTATDLIVLAAQNDPFYTGTPVDLERAEWFAGLWERFGYQSDVHLRRFHYRVVSQNEPVLQPNGKPYENTEESWIFLNAASKAARYLNLVDAGSFDDRRAGPAAIHYKSQGDFVDVNISGGSFSLDLDLPEFPELPGYEYDINVDQPYIVEIWTEKSTMNDIILPLCQKYGVNLISGVGEISITHARRVVDRAYNMGKPLRILYVSDFDPAGRSMPVAASRKIEYFARQRGAIDVTLEPVVLTPDQCIEYALPRTPIKESEKRAGRFEDRFGMGATELDAMEALHPGELREILEGHILRFYDDDLEDALDRAGDNINDALVDWQNQHIGSDIAEAHCNLKAEYDAIRENVAEQLAGIKRRAEELMEEAHARLEAKPPDHIDWQWLPEMEPEEPNEYDDPLFDSRRDYLTQLECYKRFQGK